MTDVRDDLLILSDFAYKRLRDRLEGLTDEEYLWEPAGDVWTVHPNPDGTARGDWGVLFDEPPPVTTIAWRIGHIIYCLSEERCATWLGLEPMERPNAAGLSATAAGAIEMLDRANELWRGYVSAVDDATLAEKSGPIAGIYANYTRRSFVLHILDELIHHAAEVALLRDLFRAERTRDPFVAAALRADDSAIDELRASDPQVVEKAKAEHPHLALRAAASGRWAAVPLLAELGFSLDGKDGRTPLHHAAGLGPIDIVRTLVDLGSDKLARDPVYASTPLEWAEYFNLGETFGDRDRSDVIEYLRSAGG
jgi:hypothetical protein